MHHTKYDFCIHLSIKLLALHIFNIYSILHRIISLLDIGGMGTVYKAVDLRSNDRIVAIKEMSKAKFTPQEAEIRFENGDRIKISDTKFVFMQW